MFELAVVSGSLEGDILLAEVVFFHLGLHKTSAGWLQGNFFPSCATRLSHTQIDKITEIIARIC
jgi:hypothetical protein